MLGDGHSLSHDRGHGLHGDFVEDSMRLVLVVFLLLLVPVVIATWGACVLEVATVAFPAAALGPELAEILVLALPLLVVRLVGVRRRSRHVRSSFVDARVWAHRSWVNASALRSSGPVDLLAVSRLAVAVDPEWAVRGFDDLSLLGDELTIVVPLVPGPFPFQVLVAVNLFPDVPPTVGSGVPALLLLGSLSVLGRSVSASSQSER